MVKQREKDKFEFTKKSWDYIEKAENPDLTFYYNGKIDKKQYWEFYAKGTKFRDKEGWWIKTDEGREHLDSDDELLQPAIPLFCPQCGRIMNKDGDTQAYIHEKKCLLCHIKEHANKNKKVGIKEFRRKVKLIKEALEKQQKEQEKESDETTEK